MPIATGEKRSKPVINVPYKDRKYFGKFKIVSGKHNEGGVTYFKGEVVHSKSDLNEHNSPGSVKFQQVSDDSPVDEVEEVAISPDVEESSSDEEALADLYNQYADIDTMTISDLVELAEVEEIDLAGTNNKAEKLEAIKNTFRDRQGDN